MKRHQIQLRIKHYKVQDLLYYDIYIIYTVCIYNFHCGPVCECVCVCVCVCVYLGQQLLQQLGDGGVLAGVQAVAVDPLVELQPADLRVKGHLVLGHGDV